MMTIISFVLVLGFLILIHELGHFLVAKGLNVKVEKFSIGFGPKLVAFRRGETEYMISAFPLGGYVKLLGEEPGEELENDPREFASRPVSHRMAIIIAGPLMNLLLTFALLPLAYMIGVNMPAFLDEEVKVGWVMEDSPAIEAGIQRDDIIKTIDGDDVETWEKAVTIFMSNPGRRLEIGILRGGNEINVRIMPSALEGQGGGYTGILQPMEARIGEARPGMPASIAGLKKGDLITRVDGHDVNHWIEMSNFIRQGGGKEMVLGVKQGDKEIEVKLIPRMDDVSKNYVIGVQRSEPMIFKQFGFGEAINEGVNKGLQLTYLTFDILKKLITFNLSIKSLGGPIMIAQATGAAAHSGISEVIMLMAFISLQLGILNLLPIPVLDGGHVFFLLAELGLRKPISIKTREIAQQIGFAILILLMLIVSYNDIMRILPF
ncbi:MAG: RIP metalloprotease RseP [Proteobacteria bacterium]|nr:RIP metalloprotease RseP [Pseudomonadota bacterium]